MMKISLLLALLVAVPSGAAETAAPRVEFSSFTLSNGLRVVLEEGLEHRYQRHAPLALTT